MTLCEGTSRLGGAARVAGLVEPPIADLVAWLEGRVRALGVEIRLGAELSAEDAVAQAPDAVVVATGGVRARPRVPGADAEHVLDLAGLEAALRSGSLAGRRVAIWGGGSIGLEIGEHLAGKATELTILEAGTHFGVSLAPPRLWRALHAVRGAGATLVPRAQLAAIEPGAVVYADGEGRELRAAADCVVLALPAEPASPLADALAARDLEVHRIGDCRGPAHLESAFLHALEVGAELGDGVH